MASTFNRPQDAVTQVKTEFAFESTAEGDRNAQNALELVGKLHCEIMTALDAFDTALKDVQDPRSTKQVTEQVLALIARAKLLENSLEEYQNQCQDVVETSNSETIHGVSDDDDDNVTPAPFRRAKRTRQQALLIDSEDQELTEEAIKRAKNAADARERRALEGIAGIRLEPVETSAENKAIARSITLLKRLLSAGHDQPMEIILNMGRSWKSRLTTVTIDETVPRALKDVVKKSQFCKMQEEKGGPERLFLLIDIAIDCRRLKKSHNADIQSLDKKTRNTLVEQDNKGRRIMHMGLTISAISWFGVLVLAMMGCTPTSIENMSGYEMVTFARIMSSSLAKGSVNRGVPKHYAGWIDAVVDGLIPTWERAFVDLIKNHRDKIADIFRDIFIAPRGGKDDMNFGIKLKLPGYAEPVILFMPDYDMYNGQIDKRIISIMNGKVKLDAKLIRKPMPLATKTTYLNIRSYVDEYSLAHRPELSEMTDLYKDHLYQPADVDVEFLHSLPAPIVYFFGGAKPAVVKGKLKTSPPYLDSLSQERFDKKTDCTTNTAERVTQEEVRRYRDLDASNAAAKSARRSGTDQAPAKVEL